MGVCVKCIFLFFVKKLARSGLELLHKIVEQVVDAFDELVLADAVLDPRCKVLLASQKSVQVGGRLLCALSDERQAGSGLAATTWWTLATSPARREGPACPW